MVLISNLVMQKNRGSIIDRDQDIHRAIVIKISDGHPTGGKRLSEQRAALRTYILETFASVAEQHERFLVFHLAVQTLDEVIGIAVGQEQIQIAIVVVVKKFQPPTTHQPGGRADTSRSSLIVKGLVMTVLIYGKHFAVDIGYEQVHPAVFIEVRRIHSHAGASAAVGAVSHACLSSNFFELSLSSIHKQKVGNCIVRHEKIQTAIIIYVGRHYSPSLPRIFSNARGFADIGERAIAIIAQ